LLFAFAGFHNSSSNGHSRLDLENNIRIFLARTVIDPKNGGNQNLDQNNHFANKKKTTSFGQIEFIYKLE